MLIWRKDYFQSDSQKSRDKCISYAKWCILLAVIRGGVTCATVRKGLEDPYVHDDV